MILDTYNILTVVSNKILYLITKKKFLNKIKDILYFNVQYLFKIKITLHNNTWKSFYNL